MKESSYPGENTHKPAPTAQPLVTVIVLTWNMLELTRRCLLSLFNMTYRNFKVVVIDNNSSDNTVEMIEQDFPGCTTFINPSNFGFAKGVNIGIRHAYEVRSEFVFLINNDTIVPPDILDVLVPRAQTEHESGIFMPRISNLGESQQDWFIGSRKHWLTLDASDFSSTGMRSKSQPFNKYVDFVFGTALFIRMNVFERIGLFDERFFLYYEDMDLSNRAHAAGIKLEVIPELTVEHQISASTDKSVQLRYYHKARSSVLYYRKYSSGFRSLLIVPYRILSALLTTYRLIRNGRFTSIGAYYKGLIDGLQTRIEDDNKSGVMLLRE